MRVKVMSDEQYSVYCIAMNKFEPRLKAIVSLMLFCGLRNGEVCSLNWKDVFVNGFITNSIYIKEVNSKTGVPRHVSVPSICKDALEGYLKEVTLSGRSPSIDDPLFVTKNRKIRLQPKDLQRFISVTSFSSLGVLFTPHALRHTYATRVLRFSNIRVVQMLLGHKNLHSTEIYTHPNSSEMQSAVDRAFTEGGK